MRPKGIKTISAKPTIHVIAGPNGAGKTTFAMSYLPEFAGCREFVNADLIAAGLSPFNPDSQAVAAGRLMLGRIDELARRRETFAIETTLAGRGHAQRLRKLKEQFGYTIELIFVWLPTADFAVERVANRVRQGGHNIPEPTIRRRFDQGIRNFADHYSSLADRWAILDATWYPSESSVSSELGQTVCFRESTVASMNQHTPALLANHTISNASEPTGFVQRLESAADEATRTIVETARSISTPILTWRDGATVRFNSITERRIPDDVRDD
ncbi:Zeta toxin [Rubripirellula tenax]|uniref:Zeta toxin n=1 Tax=Rubripirellula tenax TaxID=2528015 RepID=A0A5C6F646_9BACT|nr:AAA family ATPase [Rubripirellula tenax]TWU54961.1 Zeta toxin [Rubripirellula tenax]